MLFFSFLLKLRYGSYRNSQRASLYEEMASAYKVSPQHIYEIAHGKKVRSAEDARIHDDLISKGIIVDE
ncbi:MAG: hypothetical protein IKD78_01690 [Bacteroidales bacterium]|nr:hypothetical protein [Bacteroidales bacterium]